MPERFRVTLLVTILMLVTLVSITVAVWVLYRAAFAGQRERLVETVQSRARLMEAMARFAAAQPTDHPGGAAAATLEQVRDAHARFAGFGDTGEFTLARREANQIVFILRHRHADLAKPLPIPFASNLAEPMRRALSGSSGTVVGLDYRGATVLAAYEPVAVLDLGIVAKIDLAEIRAPFIRAALIVAVIAIALIAIGTLLFFRITDPMLRRILDSEARYRQLSVELEHRVAGRTVELQAANRELEAFTHTVSHDLRAPLRALDGFSQALLEDYGDRLDGEARLHLQYLRDGSADMGRLIDALLKLSRATRSELRREVVDLSRLACDVVDELRESEPGREVRVDLPPVARVHADPRLMRVVLVNLLGNAWKFTREAAGAHIECVAEHIDGNLVFRVRDNGAGFDMTYADKLFKPFYRLHRTSEFEGSGIGLSTVERIVQRHGGRIWAQGAVGKGATVWFEMEGVR